MALEERERERERTSSMNMGNEQVEVDFAWPSDLLSASLELSSLIELT